MELDGDSETPTYALQVRRSAAELIQHRREKASRIPVSLAPSLFAYISLSIDYPVQLLKTLTASLL